MTLHRATRDLRLRPFLLSEQEKETLLALGRGEPHLGAHAAAELLRAMPLLRAVAQEGSRVDGRATYCVLPLSKKDDDLFRRFADPSRALGLALQAAPRKLRRRPRHTLRRKIEKLARKKVGPEGAPHVWEPPPPARTLQLPIGWALD